LRLLNAIKLFSLQLNVHVQKTAKTKEKINLTITSKPNSKVFLLAYDKRLTYMREGNEITNNTVLEPLSDYEKDNNVYVYDMNLNNWNFCTQEELQRIRNGANPTKPQSGGYVIGNDGPPDDETEVEGTQSYVDLITIKEDEEGVVIRETFNEVWIFDDIEMKSNKISKTYKVPDSLTTWQLSAFSLHKDDGFSMIQSQELVVKNELFMVMNLPYSIRYKEVLRVDILVYNYVRPSQKLNVNVKLFNKNGNEFKFVELKGNNRVYGDHQYEEKSIEVPADGVKAASFFICKFHGGDKEVIKTTIYLKAEAKTRQKKINGKPYEDILKRKLLVEPIGILYHDDIPRNKFLNSSETPLNGMVFYTATGNSILSRVNVIILSDYLSESIESQSKYT
jgi:hypothetical protein